MMRKTLCFLCHKNTKPLSMMVDYFSKNKNNRIIIHIDAKADINEFNDIRKGDNVSFLSKRYDVTWGGVNMVSASIALLNEALLADFDYLFLLSGEDLACMDEASIDDVLKGMGYSNLIHFQDERNNYVNPDDRVRYKYPSYFFKKKLTYGDFLFRQIFKLTKSFYINNAYSAFISSGGLFYKGSQWFGLNYKTVSVIVDFLNRNQWYFAMYERSLIPDEVFFHTLIKYIGINDIHIDKAKISDALRYTDWSTGPDYPRTLDVSDLEKIKKSGCLFARKFSHETTSSVFEELVSRH